MQIAEDIVNDILKNMGISDDIKKEDTLQDVDIENNQNVIIDEDVSNENKLDEDIKSETVVTPNETNSLIKAFKEQEDEIKEKLKRSISQKALNTENVKSQFSNNVAQNLNNGVSGSTVNSEQLPKDENFMVSGDTSGISTSSLENKEDDIYIEDLITIVTKTDENTLVIKHVDRASLKDLEEDKDYKIMLEWDSLIPDNATIDDVDTIFTKGLESFSSSVIGKEKELKETLNITSDVWVENLKEKKKGKEEVSEKINMAKTETESNINNEKIDTMITNDIMNIKSEASEDILKTYSSNIDDNDEDLIDENIIDDIDDNTPTVEMSNNNENKIDLNSVIDDDIDEIDIDDDLSFVQDLPIIDEDEKDNSIKNLITKSSDDLLRRKVDSINKTIQLSRAYDQINEIEAKLNKDIKEIDDELNGFSIREDGAIQLGSDFWNNYTIEEQGELLKDFTFKTLIDTSNEMLVRHKENSIKEEVVVESVVENENKVDNQQVNSYGMRM